MAFDIITPPIDNISLVTPTFSGAFLFLICLKAVSMYSLVISGNSSEPKFIIFVPWVVIGLAVTEE